MEFIHMHIFQSSFIHTILVVQHKMSWRGKQQQKRITHIDSCDVYRPCRSPFIVEIDRCAKRLGEQMTISHSLSHHFKVYAIRVRVNKTNLYWIYLYRSKKMAIFMDIYWKYDRNFHCLLLCDQTYFTHKLCMHTLPRTQKCWRR